MAALCIVKITGLVMQETNNIFSLYIIDAI